ncbi:MAG: DUF4157 domain-containing protein, partial [Candidatus Promineifilaceae bacterium]
GLGGACGACGREKRLGIQPKLRLNRPGDRYEQEADRVAEQVMAMPEPKLQRRTDEEDEEDELLRTKPLVQRRATGGGAAGEAPASVRQALRAPGQPLDSVTRSFMESRFRQEFGRVRVHTDALAAESAAALNAAAYTAGEDVVFGRDQFAPGTAGGRRLLAHELAHVVQQGAAKPAASPTWPAIAGIAGPQNGVMVQRSYGAAQDEEGSRWANPAPGVIIGGEAARRPREEEETAPPAVESGPGEELPEIQRQDGGAPAAPARPSLTVTPSAALTRGGNLTAAVSFSPTAGERMSVTSWEYITPSHGTVSRPTSDVDFQTQWAGTMALGGRLRLRWHYLPADTVVETLERPISVNDRTGAPWASAVTDNAEAARAGQPSPPRQFNQLGIHNANVTNPAPTRSTISGGPNHAFAFVSSLTAGSYTSSPQLHPDVTNAASAFRRFHRDASVLFKVSPAGAKTRIPVSDYSNLNEGPPLTWDVPDWEAFYKRHGIFTVQATAGATTRTVAHANWGLASNAHDATLQITDEAAVRTQLGIGPADAFSISVVVNFSWQGNTLMPSADIPGGVRSHEFAHAMHSHRANFHKMMRALDPQRVIERTVSTPSNTVDFAAKLSDLQTEILEPNHEIVDEAKSRREEEFAATAGQTMAGINTSPDTGAFLGNVWDIPGNAPMT